MQRKWAEDADSECLPFASEFVTPVEPVICAGSWPCSCLIGRVTRRVHLHCAGRCHTRHQGDRRPQRRCTRDVRLSGCGCSTSHPTTSAHILRTFQAGMAGDVNLFFNDRDGDMSTAEIEVRAVADLALRAGACGLAVHNRQAVRCR